MLRRMAFTRFILLRTDGFVKYVRFLNSLRIPDRSYFFLKRLSALSIGSFSWTMTPTTRITFLFVNELRFEVNLRRAEKQGRQEMRIPQSMRFTGQSELTANTAITFVSGYI
jgi:hypothetical protein